MSIRFDVINYFEFKLFIDGIGVIDGWNDFIPKDSSEEMASPSGGEFTVSDMSCVHC